MMGPRAGFALVAVLWVLVLVATLLLAVRMFADGAVATARNRADGMRASWLAEGCAESAWAAADEVLRSTAASTREDAWVTLDRLADQFPVPEDLACSVIFTAVTSTLDANTISAPMLTDLFRAMGLQDLVVDSLVDALLDWRDPDDTPRLNGAEANWYLSRGRPPPRNAPLANARELLRIRGFDAIPGILDLLGTEPGPVSVNHAPAAVLAALPGLDRHAAQQLIEMRKGGGIVSDLRSLKDALSPDLVPAFHGAYADLSRVATTLPLAWDVTTRAGIGQPALVAAVQIRLVQNGERLAVVWRRVWLE